MQSHLECRLWNEIFVDAQKELGIPNGTPACLVAVMAGQMAGQAAWSEVQRRTACVRILFTSPHLRTNQCRHHQGHVPD